jgi:FKBP-type peptidyl-prolyl cis-trans isomerase
MSDTGTHEPILSSRPLRDTRVAPLISCVLLRDDGDMIGRAVLLVLAVSALGACKLKDENAIAPPPDVAAPPADALRTPSGLASKVLQVGLGSQHPGLRSTVTVIYTGWTTDGHMFDSSTLQGHPVSFRVDQVIPGWTEGLQLMVVGEKRRFWIPASLAYGNNPQPGFPAGMLVFDVELIDIR